MAPTPHRAYAGPDADAEIAAVKSWYHCIDLGEGRVTPGVFDLRPIVERMPWPDVRGKRCLDIGTYDGFLAFELERRGAAEVVALEILSYEDWDWELHFRALGPEYLRLVVGPDVGAGFRIARRLRGSAVSLEQLSVYDLSPERVGHFDVVVCGSLLLHLRDPLRALAAIHSVCAGTFLSTDQVELGLSLLHRHRPLVRLDGTSGLTQWWLPNAAGHRQMLRAAGFEMVRQSGLYAIPYGPGHPARSRRPGPSLVALVRRAVAGNDGVVHHAVLARPRGPSS